MDDVLTDFRQTIADATARLGALTEAQITQPRGAEQWTAKQIIGHLIDSAANNHRRFVLAQLQPDMDFPGYAQEDWVRVQRYDAAPWPLLVQLWQSYNLHLLHIMAHAPAAQLQTPRPTHSLDRIAWQTVSQSEPTTLAYLMRDYVGHLQHHLKQIFAGT